MSAPFVLAYRVSLLVLGTGRERLGSSTDEHLVLLQYIAVEGLKQFPVLS